jgi:hypothetical protein
MYVCAMAASVLKLWGHKVNYFLDSLLYIEKHYGMNTKSCVKI